MLVEVHAAAVNFVDLVMMSGKYQFTPPLPFIPGKLPAGIVSAVGAGVTKFKPGDHAIAMAEQGGFAEFVADAGEPVHSAAARRCRSTRRPPCR